MELSEGLKIGSVLIVMTGIWYFLITKKSNNESQMDIFLNKFKVKEGMTDENRKSHNTNLTSLNEDLQKLKEKIKVDKPDDDKNKTLYIEMLEAKKEMINMLFVILSLDQGMYDGTIKNLNETKKENLKEMNEIWGFCFKYKKILSSAIKIYESPPENTE
jgi:hypothetical protein